MTCGWLKTLLVFIFVYSGGLRSEPRDPALERLQHACLTAQAASQFRKILQTAFDAENPNAVEGMGTALDLLIGIKAYLGSDEAVREMSGRMALWSERQFSGWSMWYDTALDLYLHLNIKPGEVLVDFGSSVGRFIIVGGVLFPRSQFIGYEIVEDRVAQSHEAIKILGLSNVQNFQQDLSDPRFVLPRADHYFFYESLNHLTFSQILDKILIANPLAQIILEDGNGESYQVLQSDSRFEQVGMIEHNKLMKAYVFKARPR